MTPFLFEEVRPQSYRVADVCYTPSYTHGGRPKTEYCIPKWNNWNDKTIIKSYILISFTPCRVTWRCLFCPIWPISLSLLQLVNSWGRTVDVDIGCAIKTTSTVNLRIAELTLYKFFKLVTQFAGTIKCLNFKEIKLNFQLALLFCYSLLNSIIVNVLQFIPHIQNSHVFLLSSN